jgi:hypothetical protein
MANPTTNYSFAMPTNSDLVKDLPADFEVFGQAVDTQMKTNADAAIAKTIVDAKGDLIAATAADTVARLAVGTNGQVLLADSAEATGLKWGTPASGGMTLISTTTLTGASVTLSSIPSTYRHLQLVIRNHRPATDDDNFVMRFNGDTANRYNQVAFNDANNNIVSFGSANIIIANGIDNGASSALTIIDIPDYANTATWKMSHNISMFPDKTTPTSSKIWKTIGQYNQTGAISSITLYGELGNFTSGTVLLYGVQ